MNSCSQGTLCASAKAKQYMVRSKAKESYTPHSRAPHWSTDQKLLADLSLTFLKQHCPTLCKCCAWRNGQCSAINWVHWLGTAWYAPDGCKEWRPHGLLDCMTTLSRWHSRRRRWAFPVDLAVSWRHCTSWKPWRWDPPSAQTSTCSMKSST